MAFPSFNALRCVKLKNSVRLIELIKPKKPTLQSILCCNFDLQGGFWSTAT